MALYLTILQIVAGVAGAALTVRAAWLLARGEYRHGIIHVGLATVAFVVAVGFFLARGLFLQAA